MGSRPARNQGERGAVPEGVCGMRKQGSHREGVGTVCEDEDYGGKTGTELMETSTTQGHRVKREKRVRENKQRGHG